MEITTVILCGGKGTRAYPATATVPKPLMHVGDQPIVGHVMEIYASQGFNHFILAAGYLHEQIEAFAETVDPSWKVTVVDTGEETATGGRLEAISHLVTDTFFATYADGLGDVDLRRLLATHWLNDGAATMTTVPLPSQYGTVQFDSNGRVQKFLEKPKLADHYINAGFFAFDRRVFDLWHGDDLERDVLPALAHAGELFIHTHQGFWKSMDTYKDAQELSALCTGGGTPPWTWSR